MTVDLDVFDEGIGMLCTMSQIRGRDVVLPPNIYKIYLDTICPNLTNELFLRSCEKIIKNYDEYKCFPSPNQIIQASIEPPKPLNCTPITIVTNRIVGDAPGESSPIEKQNEYLSIREYVFGVLRKEVEDVMEGRGGQPLTDDEVYTQAIPRKRCIELFNKEGIIDVEKLISETEQLREAKKNAQICGQ